MELARLMHRSLSLTSLPVEVIELVAKEGGLATRDLNALCLTSRLLWKVVSPVMYRHVHVIANVGHPNGSKMDSILTLLSFSNRSNGVRTFTVTDPHGELFQFPHGYILPYLTLRFTALTSVSIPFKIISNQFFDTVYAHDTIANLEITAYDGLMPSQFKYARRYKLVVPRPAGFPIVLRNFTGFVQPVAPPKKMAVMQDFLAYLDSFGIVVPEMAVEYRSVCPLHAAFWQVVSTRGPLTVGPVPHLTDLSVTFNHLSMPLGLVWLMAATQRQESLVRITVTIDAFTLDHENFRNKPFTFAQYGPPRWRPHPQYPFAGKIHNNNIPTDQGLEWKELEVAHYNGEYEKGEDLFELKRMEIAFKYETKVLETHLASLFTETEMMANIQHVELTVNHWIGDWDDIACRFGHLRSLTSLHLHGSLTPHMTLGVTLACSIACCSVLSQAHPDRHAAAELVGGPFAFTKLLVMLNYNRFLSILPYLPHGCKARLTAQGKKGEQRPIFDVALMERRGAWELVPGSKPETGLGEDVVQRQNCFACTRMAKKEEGAWRGVVDPVSAVMHCPAEEVRRAATGIGLDLQTWEKFFVHDPSRPSDMLSVPVMEPDSFEAFLRDYPNYVEGPNLVAMEIDDMEIVEVDNQLKIIIEEVA